MGLAIFAFHAKVAWGCYSLLFLLSTHSALFGPSKYGIIAELVPADAIPKANGLITSFTYLAIIVGTFLASFLTEITNRHFVFIALFCWLVAFVGFLSALCIKKTFAQGSNKKINWFFVREIYHTLVFCKSRRHLLPAIFGAAYFLFLGAFTQLNIIPFALQSLHLQEVSGGYLFLSTALGIAFGAYVVGKALKKRVELGLPCLAGLGLSLLFVLLWIFSASLVKVVILLIATGILGGIFTVPFDSFIQIYSPNEKRGQVIGASNFLSFLGVLLASFALYLFSHILHFSSASGFAAVGILTAIVSLILCIRLSDMTIPYLSKKILYPLCKFHPPAIDEKSPRTLILLPEGSWKEALLLSGAIPNLHFYIAIENKRCHPWIHTLFPSMHVLRQNITDEELSKIVKDSTEIGTTPCLLLDKGNPLQSQNPFKRFLNFFTRSSVQILYAHFHEKTPSSPYTFSLTKTETPQ